LIVLDSKVGGAEEVYTVRVPCPSLALSHWRHFRFPRTALLVTGGDLRRRAKRYKKRVLHYICWIIYINYRYPDNYPPVLMYPAEHYRAIVTECLSWAGSQ